MYVSRAGASSILEVWIDPLMGRCYEFFAGAGMARAGLGSGWTCVFANDIDPKKASSYIENWGGRDFRLADVAQLTANDLPGEADLAWASFPCQDLSLAGSGAGLQGTRSGTFWSFWDLMKALAAEGRSPAMIVLENVCGALTSHGGRDFRAIGSAVSALGYRFGALVIDAVGFVPQSRPRLFVVAARSGLRTPPKLLRQTQSEPWFTKSLSMASEALPEAARKNWVWWNLPSPQGQTATLDELIDDEPEGVPWHSPAETARLLDMMSDLNRDKVRRVSNLRRRVVGTIYRRTRLDATGRRTQRAEVRFDGIAGCLRTPQGGSSRQTLMIVEGASIRSRLLAPREAARLMGLPDSYRLPANYNQAYHLAGDGVVVPVVRHLATHILDPILIANAAARPIAA